MNCHLARYLGFDDSTDNSPPVSEQNYLLDGDYGVYPLNERIGIQGLEGCESVRCWAFYKPLPAGCLVICSRSARVLPVRGLVRVVWWPQLSVMLSHGK